MNRRFRMNALRASAPLRFAAVLASLAIPSLESFADWITPDGAQIQGTDSNHAPITLSDRANGAFFVWYTGPPSRVYIERVNSSGGAPSGWNGPPMTASLVTSEQTYPVAASDCGGGVFIAWQDGRNATSSNDAGDDIFAQHLNANGIRATSDYPVCASAKDQSQLAMTTSLNASQEDGAIIVWQDGRDQGLGYHKIYGQKLDQIACSAIISVAWDTGGVWVTPGCTQRIYQQYPAIASDNLGGALVVWEDHRSGSTGEIYSAHLAASDGFPIAGWGDACGLRLSAGPVGNIQSYPRIVSDGQGGAFVAWLDDRPCYQGPNCYTDVYALHIGVNVDGTVIRSR